MRRFGGDGDGESDDIRSTETRSPPYSNGGSDMKRGRSPESKLSITPSTLRKADTDVIFNPGSEADGPRRRKKRNRWGEATENKAAGLMGLPTAILADMTNEQLEAYTLHLRIEEITQKLKINDVVPADGDR